MQNETVSGTVQATGTNVEVGTAAPAPKARAPKAKAAPRVAKGTVQAPAASVEPNGLTPAQLAAIAAAPAGAGQFAAAGSRQLAPTALVAVGAKPRRGLAGHNATALAAYTAYLGKCKGGQCQAGQLQAMQATLGVRPTNVGYCVQNGWLVVVPASK